MVSACLPCLAGDGKPEAARASASADESLYVKVQLPASVRVSALKAGDVVEGTLARDVYAADRELFPAGSRVRLTVGGVERRRRLPDDHWPWIVKVFTPRSQNFPMFQDAWVSSPDGRESPLQVSLISVSRKFEVRSRPKREKNRAQKADASMEAAVVQPSEGEKGGKKNLGPVMILEGTEAATSSTDSGDGASSTLDPLATTVPSGMRCRILLLGGISASKSHAGDRVQARLLEPVLLNSRVVLPVGSLFEGTVLKQTPPRMLSRAGLIYLTFTGLTLPDRSRFPVSASLAGAELNRGSHTRIDEEGRLRGERPGKVWMLINGGLSAGISKGVDDGAQLIIEALVSSATDASTAGVSRIVSTCASAVFLLTRRGRDVVLPRFTEMDIVLNRPLSLAPAAPLTASNPGLGKE